MTWHFFISVRIPQKNYKQLVLSMYGNPKSLLHPWKSCKGCDDSSVDSVGSVDNTPSYIANSIQAGKAILLLLDDNLHSFFVCTYILLAGPVERFKI